jgi:hypothetical protein
MSDESTSARMSKAVSQAKEAYEHIVPSSSACDAVGIAVDSVASVDDVFTRAVAWEPLLERIKLFMEIVDKIVEVYLQIYKSTFCPIPLTYVRFHRFILMRRWRGQSYPQHTWYIYHRDVQGKGAYTILSRHS